MNAKTNDATAALKLDNQLCFALYSANLALNKLYRQLLAEKVFRLAVRIRRDEAGRTYEVEELPW